MLPPHHAASNVAADFGAGVLAARPDDQAWMLGTCEALSGASVELKTGRQGCYVPVWQAWRPCMTKSGQSTQIILSPVRPSCFTMAARKFFVGKLGLCIAIAGSPCSAQTLTLMSVM